MANRDYYGDSESDMDEKPDMGSESESEEKDTTALIPKSLLAGKEFKPGEEIMFKIVHMYDDEVEIEYSHSDKKEEKSEPKSQHEMSDEMLVGMGKEE